LISFVGERTAAPGNWAQGADSRPRWAEAYTIRLVFRQTYFGDEGQWRAISGVPILVAVWT
jgi:hypothetical protein